VTTLFASSTATFSPCNRYRYTLTRTWDANVPPVVFCMLNPSTATADRNDPTITRCIDFAQCWGHGGLVVVNIFAYRSTDPDILRSLPDPIGPDNDEAILRETFDRRTIAAWGCDGKLDGRGAAVLRLLGGRRVECLKATKEGHPQHPLYMPAATVPVPYPITLKGTP
jgi:hypothetical protein